MGTTFLKPASILPKTRFATPNLTSLEFQVVRAKATESYNEFEQRVPLLSFHGAEDLLNRFINPTLPYNDTTKTGQAFFSGNLKVHEFGFTFDKNFTDGIFFSFEGTITNAIFDNIGVLPVSSTCRLLSEEEISQNAELTNYLKTFHNKFLADSCEFTFKQAGPLFFTLGYAKNFQHFEHADFVDVSIKAGVAVPSINLNTTNSTDQNIFKIPTYSRVNIGIPIQASFEAGFYEWLNISATGILIPFISNDVIMRLNPTATNNILLSQDQVLTKVRHHPFIYFDTYIAAEHLIPQFTCILGISYAKQFKTTYQPCDMQKYPESIVNKYSLHKPWEILSLTFEAEVDFSTIQKQSFPRLKIIYVHPIYGKSIYKSAVFAGQFALEFSYDF